MSIYRWYNSMIFGTEAPQVTVASTHAAPVKTASAAPVAHSAIDPFVLSQINR
jgi:hypothetical protein